MTAEEFRTTWEHVCEIPIAWGDMDAMGHVNNATYFRYFESGRIDFLKEFQSVMPVSAQSIGPILAYIDCKFVAPVTYPDTILVGSQVRGLGNTSVKMSQSIYSIAQKRVVAGGDSVLVVFDYTTGQKVPVPEVIRKKYQHLS